MKESQSQQIKRLWISVGFSLLISVVGALVLFGPLTVDSPGLYYGIGVLWVCSTGIVAMSIFAGVLEIAPSVGSKFSAVFGKQGLFRFSQALIFGSLLLSLLVAIAIVPQTVVVFSATDSVQSGQSVTQYEELSSYDQQAFDLGVRGEINPVELHEFEYVEKNGVVYEVQTESGPLDYMISIPFSFLVIGVPGFAIAINLYAAVTENTSPDSAAEELLAPRQL